MPTPFRLETERLILRQWRDDDLPAFAVMSQDEGVMEHLGPLMDKAASGALAQRMRSLIDEQGWGFWAVEEKKGASFIGCIGLAHMPQELPAGPGVEVGWRLARPFWGKGYATEAAKECLRFAFSRLGLDVVFAYAAIINGRSQAVMERLGMLRTSFLFDHPKLAEDNPSRRHCLYRTTREEWLKLRESGA